MQIRLLIQPLKAKVLTSFITVLNTEKLKNLFVNTKKID